MPHARTSPLRSLRAGRQILRLSALKSERSSFSRLQNTGLRKAISQIIEKIGRIAHPRSGVPYRCLWLQLAAAEGREKLDAGAQFTRQPTDLPRYAVHVVVHCIVGHWPSPFVGTARSAQEISSCERFHSGFGLWAQRNI